MHVLPAVKCSEGGEDPSVTSPFPWGLCRSDDFIRGTAEGLSGAVHFGQISFHCMAFNGLAGNEAGVGLQEGEGAIIFHQDKVCVELWLPVCIGLQES